MQRQRKNRNSYFGKVDFIFYSERDIREAVTQARLSVGNGNGMVAANKNGFSDPTANQAVKNLSPLEKVTIRGEHVIQKPEKWLEVIEKTYSWCKKQKDNRFEVAKRRYEGEDYRKTCRELNLSNSTRRRLLEYVQIYATLQAVQLGLIQI